MTSRLGAGGTARESSTLEDTVLEICRACESGMTDADIRSQLPANVTPLVRSSVYNTLLSRGRLQVVERPVGEDGKRVVVYKWVSEENARKLAGLSAAERMAYELIAKSKEHGQTRKDIKAKTNIQNSTELKGIIERLTARGLIKEIKSVASSNKRVYIIAELEASPTHTGGPWYGDDQEFDQEFIQALYDFSLVFIAEQQLVTVEDVTEHVARSGLSNEPLTTEDIRKLMYTMLQDAQIELCDEIDPELGQVFRKTRPLPSARKHMMHPCLKCPVKKHCTPGGVISQSNCVYMNEWISTSYDW
jgi:hypothetical protein